MKTANVFLPAAVLTVFLTNPVHAQNPTVRFHTNQGDIDVILQVDVAPKTVTNFLNYVNKGAYDNTIFHRSVKNFVIQGGGYQLQSGTPVLVPTDPPVQNEFNLSNKRGTVAMAKFGNQPDSATNQWFFNVADNNTGTNNLDIQNGGFTVFGIVANDASLAVMDKIAALPTTVSGEFSDLPVINYTQGKDVTSANYVVVTSIEQFNTQPQPSIKTDGVISASAFGGFPSGSPGTYLEIYGSNLAGTSREWATSDFGSTSGRKAPTSLDSVTVTINGRSAYVSYISPTQVNVQIPDNFPRSGTYPLVLTYLGLSSAPYSVQIDPVMPTLLAPASFKVGDQQFVAALHGGSTALVANSSIPGVAPAPAAPGETITIFGLGWGGVVNTAGIAGEINTGINKLEGTVEMSVGGIPATVAYAGLAPGLVGVDQFNIVVPTDAPNGDLPFVAKLNGTPILQSLYLPVQKQP